MFATRQPNVNRRLAGQVGGLVGATAMLLTVYPTIAGAVPALKKLSLKAVCTIVSGEAAGQAVMVVGNENDNSVVYDWAIASSSGTRNAPFGNNYELFPAATGKLTLKVGDTQQDSLAEDPTACMAHVAPTKFWLDADGAPIESPLVPQGWALTLQSDVETLTCTWNSGLDELKCHSVDDPEDKLEFVDLDKSLEVPIGGTYTISETPTPGFDRTGLGDFGPINLPANRAAFFAGGNKVPVLVTNAEQAAEETTTTTAAATTTTTASPPTTLAPVEDTTTTTEAEETTTTTSVEETTTSVDETTTTAAEETTTTAAEETTTSVDETTTTAAEETTTTSVEETTTTSAAPPTTLAPVEDTTTTTNAEESTTTTTTEAEGSSSTTEADESTTTTAADLKVSDESTTTTAAPTTSAASSTTTRQTTTTVAPTDTGSATTASQPATSAAPFTTLAAADPDDALRGATEPLSESPGQTGSPTEVHPNFDESDTLPTTGGTPFPAVVLGLLLIAIGRCIARAGRRRLDA